MIGGHSGLGFVSDENSSSTALAGDATFTGTAIDVSHASSITVTAYADVASATRGIKMQFSKDGANWDTVRDATLSAGSTVTYVNHTKAKYFRVLYTNGADAQSAFRIQTLAHTGRPPLSIVSSAQALDPWGCAIAVRDAASFELNVQRGLHTGMSVVHKFGRNNDLGSSVEDLWTTGGLYTWRTAAVTLEAISTSTNDASGGTGARQIVVEGLDANFAEISETITMNGTSATTATTNSFLRVNRAYVSAAGAYATTTQAGGAAGEITVRGSGAGTTECKIVKVGADTVDWGFNQSQVARYTVPANKTAYMYRTLFTNQSGKSADFVFWQRRDAGTIAAPFSAKRIVFKVDGVNGIVTKGVDFPYVFPAETDLWVSARLSSGANGQVSARFDLLIVDDLDPA